MSLSTHVEPALTGVFDWYQVTTDTKIERFRELMSQKYDLADWLPIKGINNYHLGNQLVRGDQVLLKAFWGGANGDNVHAIATGFEARAFSKFMRELTGVRHIVTQAHCAIDFNETQAWDSIEEISKQVADKHRIKIQHLGDFHRKIDGRTLNLGGNKADVRATNYEKGIQVGSDKDWVRAEVKVRPPRPHPDSKGINARVAMATMEPIELWGCSTWSRDLLTQLTGQIVPTLSMRSWRPSDHDKAYHFLLKQHKNTLARLLKIHGSPFAVGEQIYDDLLAMELQNNLG